MLSGGCCACRRQFDHTHLRSKLQLFSMVWTKIFHPVDCAAINCAFPLFDHKHLRSLPTVERMLVPVCCHPQQRPSIVQRPLRSIPYLAPTTRYVSVPYWTYSTLKLHAFLNNAVTAPLESSNNSYPISPSRAPKSLPILTSSKFVPEKGFQL